MQSGLFLFHLGGDVSVEGFFIVSVSDGLMQIWCGYANEVVTRVFLPLWPGHLELGAKINESLIRGK